MSMRDLFRGDRERDRGRESWRDEGQYGREDVRRYSQGQDWGGERNRERERYRGAYGEPQFYGQSGRSDWREGDYSRDQEFQHRGYGQGEYGRDYREPSRRDEQHRYGAGRDYGETGAGLSGLFRGRGPRGYQRSDERIREEVCECLTDDSNVDASNVEVNVKNGEVMLSGTVGSRQEKRRAAEIIEDLSGVKDVHNNLRVASEQSTGMQSTGAQSTQTQTPRH